MENIECSIAVDVMGGDNAPNEIVLGIIDAIKDFKNIEILAVGDEDSIVRILDENNFSSERIKIVHTDEVIETSESPVIAIRSKKNSSLVTAIKLVNEKRVAGCLSAGNSGALLVGAQTYIKKIGNIKRSPLAPIIPTLKGPAVLVDCGANVDSKPEYLVDFARLGYFYAKKFCNIDNPKVAILNIGAEEEKGNKLVKETFPLLKSDKIINFIGSIEARDILTGYADVIICDAFVGNVALKVTEGIFSLFMSTLKSTIMTNPKTKIGGLLIKKQLKKSLKPFDISMYGGAPLLGLDGLVVKCHGNATRKEIYNGIRQTYEFSKNKINNIIREELEKNGV